MTDGKYMSCALLKLNRYCSLTQIKKNVEKKPTKKQLFYHTRISILSILYRSAVNKVVYGQYVKVYCQKWHWYFASCSPSFSTKVNKRSRTFFVDLYAQVRRARIVIVNEKQINMENYHFTLLLTSSYFPLVYFFAAL